MSYTKADKEQDKQRLDNAVNFLLKASTDHDFDSVLRRMRELCKKLKIDFKDYILTMLSTPTTNTGKIITAETSDSLIKELEKKIDKLQQNNMTLIFEKNKLQEIVEHYNKNYGKHSKIQNKSIKLLQQENENNINYINKLHKSKEFSPMMAQKSVVKFIRFHELKINKNEWISTQTLYKKCKPYFEGSPISIKRFSLEFGNKLGISSVIGGKQQKNKGFNVHSPTIKSEKPKN